MAGVSTPELAAAVTNAGGWGRWAWAPPTGRALPSARFQSIEGANYLLLFLTSLSEIQH